MPQSGAYFAREPRKQIIRIYVLTLGLSRHMVGVGGGLNMQPERRSSLADLMEGKVSPEVASVERQLREGIDLAYGKEKSSKELAGPSEGRSG